MTEDSRPKRVVSYNQEAVLCPVCKKRIRLNNDGCLRVHFSGKMGSEKCMGSKAHPDKALPTIFIQDDDGSVPPVTIGTGVNLFSDQP